MVLVYLPTQLGDFVRANVDITMEYYMENHHFSMAKSTILTGPFSQTVKNYQIYHDYPCFQQFFQPSKSPILWPSNHQWPWLPGYGR